MAIPTIALTPVGVKLNKIYSQLPTNGDGDLVFTRASTATRVNSSGLIENVLTGIPRRDYLDGTCPTLLLEPQSTNQIINSEDLTNASYTKTGGTVVANNSTSPKGDLTMDLFKESAVSESHNFNPGTLNIIANVTQTVSVFFKKNTGSAQRYLRIDLLGTSFTNGGRVLFDIETGLVSLSALNIGTGTGATGRVKDYGNGIYRASLSVNLNGGLTQARVNMFLQDQTASFVATYLGDGSSGVNLWGLGLESLPSASSYNPTLATTVTRVADTGVKTGDVSAYVNNKSILIEFEAKLFYTGEVQRISLNDNTFNSRISISFEASLGSINVFFIKDTVGFATFNLSGIDLTGYNTYKILCKDGKQALKINDTEVATASIASVPFTELELTHLKLSNAGDSSPFFGRIKDILIYSDTTIY